MGGEKDTVEKQGGKRGKPEPKRMRRTSYVGMGPDEYISLSYTERVELGLHEEDVPEGPDRITADDWAGTAASSSGRARSRRARRRTSTTHRRCSTTGSRRGTRSMPRRRRSRSTSW
jgi:hypothetical protein